MTANADRHQAAERVMVRPKSMLIGAITLGVIVRIAASLYAGPGVVPLPGAFDQLWYDELAQRVSAGHGFSFGRDTWPLTRSGQPTAFWSYLYTTLLAALYAVFGDQPLIARLIQAVAVGIFLPLGMWRLARPLVGERAAGIAALLSAGYLYFIYYSAVLMTEMATITVIVWMLGTAVDLAEVPSRRRWVVFGTLVGLGGLLRQVAILPVPLLCLWVLWRHRTLSTARGIALAAAVAFAVISPATLRNARVFQRFVLANTNAGYAFFWANHPVHGTDFTDVLGPDDPSYLDLVPLELRHLDEAALSDALMARGLASVRDDPGRYLRLSLSRIDDYFRFWPSPESSMVSNFARVLSFGILWPFMAAGLWLTRRDWRRMMPLILFAAAYTAIHLASWALIRYRLPVDAVLLVFAAVAVERVLIGVGFLPTAVDRPFGASTEHGSENAPAAKPIPARPSPPDPDTSPIPCTVCGATDAAPFLQPPASPGPVVRCRVCTMIFVSPRRTTASLIFDGDQFGHDNALRTSTDPNDLVGHWEATHLANALPHRDVLRRNHRDALARIGRFAVPPGRMLDFGCGFGLFLDSARTAGWDVAGIDPLPGHGTYARGALHLDVISDTLRPNTFASMSFDVITAFQVFEHLPDPRAELNALRRLLKPGGIIVIEVPNIATSLLRLLGPRHRHFVHDHLWFFSPVTLRRFLTENGFTVLDTVKPTRWLSARYLAARWLPRFLPAPLARPLRTAANRMPGGGAALPINVGDIVMVIGRVADAEESSG